MRLIIAIFVMLLGGCGDPEVDIVDNSHGYGFHYDYLDIETGVRVRYDQEPSVPFPPERFVDLYRETSRCTGLTADGPVIVVSPPPIMLQGFRVYGITWFDANLIVLDASFMPDTVIRHEYIHHLLWNNGVRGSQNIDHEHPLFSCDVIQ